MAASPAKVVAVGTARRRPIPRVFKVVSATIQGRCQLLVVSMMSIIGPQEPRQARPWRAPKCRVLRSAR